MTNKCDLRHLFRNKRSKLSSDEISSASTLILNQIINGKLIKGKLVMIYISSQNHQELPTDGLFLLSEHYDICVPKAVNKNGSMEAIMWSKDSLWELNPWCCCSVLSEEPQAPLHKEAANWMFKGVATTGCLIASVDDFKNGTLEILI